MKRKRLIAAFLSLMLVVTVVMPAANALGTGTIELGPNEGTSATETPVEEPAEPETPVEEPTDPGASDEQTPTDPDDTDTSDEGTEQTPTDPDDTDTSDEETATDPDDTDTSDEETPDTPAEEPTDPEEPPVVEEPTEPDTPTEEPTVPETPEQLPAEEIQEIPVEPLAAGDLTITLVDENGGPLGNETASISAAEFSRWTDVDKNIAPQIDNYQFEGAYFETDEWTWTGYQRVKTYVAQLRYNDGEWQYRTNDWGWGSSLEHELYFEYSSYLTGETGYFYIRWDGTFPDEPGQFDSSNYTTGIEVKNAVADETVITDFNYTKDDTTDYYYNNNVTGSLVKLPTLQQVQNAISYYNSTYNKNVEFDPATDVILWYVQKSSEGAAEFLNEAGKPQTIDSGTTWHIDGVLIKKDLVDIMYFANVPEEAGVNEANVHKPLGYQEVAGTEVIIGASGQAHGTVVTPEVEGYEFLGWAKDSPDSDTVLQPDTPFVLETSTNFYGVWRRLEDYTLYLKKVDGLNKPVSNVTFDITDTGGETITGTTGAEGTYRYDHIAPNETYKITETSAPTGYQMLEHPFSFELESINEGQELVLRVYDEDNHPVTELTNVEWGYDNQTKTITITVTNIGYFYIFHTANIESGPYVEEIPIDEEHVSDGTFDIVRHTEEGYLYGGYYRDYALKGDYQIDNPAESEGVSGATSYTGDQTSWDSRDAYTDEIGTAMTPEAGKTYFLKEVPNTYLHPATYVVYDTHNENKIVNLYLLTATDDANYSSVGFDVTGTAVSNSTEDVSLTTDRLYEMVKVTKDGAEYQTFTPTQVFEEIPAGLLALSTEKADYIQANANYVEAPYFVTLDGVKVTGNQNLKVYLRDTTYNGWKLPGITKIAQSKDIVNGAE